MVSKNDPTKRRNRLKAESMEIMREKMDFGRALGNIVRAEEQLIEMAAADEEPSNGRVGAVRTLIDVSKWRIGKLLPDQKAVDVTGSMSVMGSLTLAEAQKFFSEQGITPELDNEVLPE